MEEVDTLEEQFSQVTVSEKYYIKDLKKCIEWATTKPPEPQWDLIKEIKGIDIKAQRKQKAEEERLWGNEMINKKNNKQWTTKLGENLVYQILKKQGKNPEKPKKKNNFLPDWETDEYIYEVKSSSWWVPGTAGEKVLGTFIKYQDIPKLYNKPLRIVCVAFQEYELTYGKTPYFGKNVTEKTKKILDLAKSWNIEYVKFSDLVKE